MAKGNKSRKLPKRIGGVKIPKAMRKKGGAFLEMSQTPLGAQLVGGGLVAMVTALARSERVRALLAEAGYELKEVAKEAKDGAARLALGERDGAPDRRHNDEEDEMVPAWSPERLPA